jgi:hypothetical protein
LHPNTGNLEPTSATALVQEVSGSPSEQLRVHASGQVLSLQASAAGLRPQSYTTNPWQFQVVASIDAPLVSRPGRDGQAEDKAAVQATHITFRDKYVFVSYGFRGDERLGALDVFELPAAPDVTPRLLTTVFFQDMDANAVTVDRFGKLLVIGNRQPGTWSTSGRPAAMVQLSPKWTDGHWQAEFFKNARGQIEAPTFEMPGWAGNDIVNFGPMAIVSGGNERCYVRPEAPLDTGGISFVTNGTSNPHQTAVGLEVFQSFCNAQAMGISAANGTLATLKGGLKGELSLYQLDTKALSAAEMAKASKLITRIEVGSVGALGGKNRIEIHDGLVWVALGESDVKAFRTDGSSSTPVYNLDTFGAANRNEDWIANGTAISDGLIYAAYGAGGLHIATLPNAAPGCGCDAVQPRDVPSSTPTINLPWNGSLDLGGSANFVEVHNGLIFVATHNGLKVIKRIN